MRKRHYVPKLIWITLILQIIAAFRKRDMHLCHLVYYMWAPSFLSWIFQPPDGAISTSKNATPLENSVCISGNTTVHAIVTQYIAINIIYGSLEFKNSSQDRKNSYTSKNQKEDFFCGFSNLFPGPIIKPQPHVERTLNGFDVKSHHYVTTQFVL